MDTKIFQQLKANQLGDKDAEIKVNELFRYISGTLQTSISADSAAAIAQHNSISSAHANAFAQHNASVYHDAKPAFSAHKNGSTQTSISAATKITFSDELFDIGSYFASSTYTPQTSGKYFLSAAVRFTAANAVDNEQMELHIYKNGVSHKAQIVPRAGAGFCQVDVDALVDANGTTDAFDVYAVKNGAGAGDVQGVVELTYFQGFKVS